MAARKSSKRTPAKKPRALTKIMEDLRGLAASVETQATKDSINDIADRIDKLDLRRLTRPDPSR